MFNLVDKFLVGLTAMLAVALALSCATNAHKTTQLREAETRFATVSAELRASQAGALACNASIEALKETSVASTARQRASQATAASTLRTALSKPLPAAPSGCESAASWAASVAPGLVTEWTTK